MVASVSDKIVEMRKVLLVEWVKRPTDATWIPGSIPDGIVEKFFHPV